MADIRKSLGKIIKTRRTYMKMTQAKLAEIVNVDPKYISRIETGASYPSLPVVENIFNALNIDLKDVVAEPETIDKNVIISMINSNLKQTSTKNVSLINKILLLLTEKE